VCTLSMATRCIADRSYRASGVTGSPGRRLVAAGSRPGRGRVLAG